ncbi:MULTISPECIES: DUF1127 domain-containing protein [Pseudomonadaceae]|uniref:DUF1127 domain-containing protein n=1 Tax=Pseudomonas TaxID=286 RepID=UPI000E4F562C|nr:DUF1127 domain-containing protein [Halopseudomonas gallaeciensis]
MRGIVRFIEAWRRWRRRRYEHALLAGMSAAQLQDAGITRSDALEELARPWWRRKTRG